jgi:hypothetical protein
MAEVTWQEENLPHTGVSTPRQDILTPGTIIGVTVSVCLLIAVVIVVGFVAAHRRRMSRSTQASRPPSASTVQLQSFDGDLPMPATAVRAGAGETL